MSCVTVFSQLTSESVVLVCQKESRFIAINAPFSGGCCCFVGASVTPAPAWSGVSAWAGLVLSAGCTREDGTLEAEVFELMECSRSHQYLPGMFRAERLALTVRTHRENLWLPLAPIQKST